jgi:peptide/nickel transport system substrate-binding protein
MRIMVALGVLSSGRAFDSTTRSSSFLFRALCCAILFIFAGCSRPSPDEDALVIAFEASPGTLDPRYGVDAYSSRVRSLVFSSLLEVTGAGEYRPYLAESWSCDFSALLCRFVLREGLRFHDGSPLGARDVAATYAAVLKPGNASPKKALLEAVDSVVAVDARTILFHLTQATPTVTESATIGILPARHAAGPLLPPGALIGSGPYKIVRFDGEERIHLERFTDFHRGRPPIGRLTIRVVPDALMRAMELRHGTVDLVQNAIDPDTVEWLETNAPRLQVIRGPSSNFQYLGMNFDHPALSDRRVRRAIAYALDRDAIIRHLLGSQARKASGMLPPEHWAHDPAVRRYPLRVERANKLLDKAGFTHPRDDPSAPRLRLSYKTTTHELRRRIAEAIVAQLGRVGIELEVRTYEWGTFFADIRSGNFDLYTLEWVGITDPDIYRQVFHSAMMPPVGNNRGHFVNGRIDRLTEAGVAALERESRTAIYARVQRRVARKLPYVSLWWPQRIVIATRRLQQFEPHPSGSLLGLASARLHEN